MPNQRVAAYSVAAEVQKKGETEEFVQRTMLDLEIPPGFQIDRTTIDRSKSEPVGTMELTSQLPRLENAMVRIVILGSGVELKAELNSTLSLVAVTRGVHPPLYHRRPC